MSQHLPTGANLMKLEPHADDRGALTEIFRSTWMNGGPSPAQWNYTVSQAGVLRGVHLHLSHSDYVVLAEGRADIGLRDVRRGSATEGMTTLVEMSGDQPAALQVPPGVIHGLHFHERSIVLYGLSEEWDLEDDIECRWDDPELGIEWRISSPPTISERDARAPSLIDVLSSVERAQPIGKAFPSRAP